jgi:hypothetical protein
VLQRTDEAGQLHFAEAYEVIAENPAFVLQAFVDANRNLGGKPVAASQDGRADDGGKFGIDQSLAAYDNEAAIEFGVVTGMMNMIDFVGLIGLTGSPMSADNEGCPPLPHSVHPQPY